MNRQRGLTLIELTVAGAITALLGTVLTATFSQTAEQARSAKCQANLKQVIGAVGMYTLDNNGYLPGPLHPAVIRGYRDFGQGEAQGKMLLGWLLHPYVPHVGDSTPIPSTSDPVVDELFRCPTATMITPDTDFSDTVASLGYPFNYALNSFGPLSCPMSSTYSEWSHTDPPFYFGCWYATDKWPEVPGIWWDTYRQRAWKPKLLAQIRFPAAEWAVADAWYRRVPKSSGRSGQPPRREYLGTFPAPDQTSPLPSAPLHGAPPRSVRSTRNSGSSILPRCNFDGWTNQAHFDGHVSAFKGNWVSIGDGGTVNPYWLKWGGNHTTWECPY